MKSFTLICSLLLIALGAAGYYGWGVEGDGPRTLVSAIPAGFGGLMFIGAFLGVFRRRTGLQIALLAALAGGFSGLGRLTPSYLKATLEWKSDPINLVVAMTTICFLYLVVAVLYIVLPKRSKKALEEEPESIPC